MQIKKAVIPAAGFGTRFLPFTKEVPKELIPIIDKPAIEIIVDEALSSGIEEIILVLSSHKKLVRKYFETNDELESFLEKNGKTEELELVRSISRKAKIKVAIQDEQKGLGHAVLCAKEYIGCDDFAVLLGDDITVCDKPVIKQLIDVYNKTQSTVVALREVSTEDIKKYGSVKYDYKLDDETFKIDYMVEKPNPAHAPSNIAVLGRYVLTNKIFDVLKDQTPGIGNEIQLTDAINNLISHQDVYGYKFHGERFDVGTPIGYLEALVYYALNRDDVKDDFQNILKKYMK